MTHMSEGGAITWSYRDYEGRGSYLQSALGVRMAEHRIFDSLLLLNVSEWHFGAAGYYFRGSSVLVITNPESKNL